VYVKEQMGHSSIQVTVDIYGHLIPGANVSFVDQLDEVPQERAKTTPHQSAPGTHQAENAMESIPPDIADLIGGGGRTRTYDLRIMRPSL
jgi:integrase